MARNLTTGGGGLSERPGLLTQLILDFLGLAGTFSTADMTRRQGRTVVKNKKSTPKQFKRKPYTFAEKHAVISYFEAASLDSTVARFYPGVAQSQHHAISKRISKWMKESELIAFMASNVRTAALTRVRNCGVALVLAKSTELEIVRWINELRGDGVPVSSKMLEIKAIEMAEAGGVPVGLFKASPSWRMRFLKTYKLSFRARNRSSQSAPDADDALGRAFALEVLAWMALHRATRVYNADQTAVFFEMLPKKTISTRGVRTVWIKCGKKEKQRATAMLLADSDGNKYQIFLIFKTEGSKIPEVQALNDAEQHGFGKAMWREIKDIQDAYGVQVYGNTTAWWNASITVAWMDYFFGDRTESSEPVLLLLDSFSGHWTEEVKAEAARRNVFIKQIPPGLTWRSQPADVAWIKPIKDGLRSQWVDFLRYQLSRRVPNKPFSMKPPSRGDVTEWLVERWEKLSERTVISGFVKCGFRTGILEDNQHGDHQAEDPCSDDVTELVEALEQANLTDTAVGEVDGAMDAVDRVWDGDGELCEAVI